MKCMHCGTEVNELGDCPKCGFSAGSSECYQVSIDTDSKGDIEKKNQSANFKALILIAAAVLFALLLYALVISPELVRTSQYESACSDLASESYFSAAQGFRDLGAYRDSYEKEQEAIDCLVEKVREEEYSQGRYEMAVSLCNTYLWWLDPDDARLLKFQELLYDSAVQLSKSDQQESLAKALTVFQDVYLQGFKDSDKRAAAIESKIS